MKKLFLTLTALLFLSTPAWALQVNLAWTAPTTFTDGTTIPTGTTIFYDVWRATQANLSNAVKLTTSSITTTTYADSTVATGNTYFYFTRAYINAALPSGNSNVVTAITLVPSAPSGLTGVIVP